MERLKTFEECCEYLGYDPQKVVQPMEFYPKKYRKILEAHAKRIIVTDAINRQDNDDKEWLPDWGNLNERKYQPWFDMGGSSGAGFSFFDGDIYDLESTCGSRLCFKTSKGMKHMVKYFGDLFKTEFLRNP